MGNRARRPHSIIGHIKKHHRVIKNSIMVLKQPRSNSVRKQIALRRFLEILRIHSTSEEETIYQRMRGFPLSRMKILVAIQEHKIVSALADELETLRSFGHWTTDIAAKAKVLAEIMERHLRAEEKSILPMLKKFFSRAELLELGGEYLAHINEQLEDTFPTHVKF